MSLEAILAYRHFTVHRGMPMPFVSRLFRTASTVLEDTQSLIDEYQVFLADGLTFPSPTKAQALNTDSFTIGVIPFDAGPLDDANFRILASTLGKTAGRKVQVVYVDGPETAAEAVRDSTLDSALLPPDVYVTLRDSHNLSLVASERLPDGRPGYHHQWLAPGAAGVSTPREAFESDAVIAAVFPFALPTCIDLLPFIEAGFSIPEIFARIRFDQTNGNYAYKIADLFSTMWKADTDQGDSSQLAICATTDIDINASKLPLSKLTRSAHTFPFVEKYAADWKKVFPYYTPFFAEALGFSVNLQDQSPKHYLDLEDQLVTVWRSPEIPGRAFVTAKGNEIEVTCPPNYQTADEWNTRFCFAGLIESDDTRYDIIHRALSLKREIFDRHTETELRVGGGAKKGEATEKGMPETIYHDLRFGGSLVKPSERWDCSPGGWLRSMMRVD